MTPPSRHRAMHRGRGRRPRERRSSLLAEGGNAARPGSLPHRCARAPRPRSRRPTLRPPSPPTASWCWGRRRQGAGCHRHATTAPAVGRRCFGSTTVRPSTPRARNRSRGGVPELTAMGWGMSWRAANSRSNMAPSGPRVSEPDVSASSMSAQISRRSASGNTGRAAGTRTSECMGGQYDDRHDGLVPGRQRSGNRSSPGGQIGAGPPRSMAKTR